jgi:glutathione S-transferase
VAVAHRLFVVNGSHPCRTVEKAMEIKGIPYRAVELPPPFHAPIQRLVFGRRTVPGLRLESGEKISGSRPILRRLEELQPDPPLLPADGDRRRAVEEAEAWGDEVLQSLVRRILWIALDRHREALVGMQEGGRLPPLPAPVVRVLAPGLIRAEKALNDATDEAAARDLRDLPAHLDKVDAWLADGTLGGDPPNVADLQIAPSIRLLSVVGDVRPLLEGRPADAWARRLFPAQPGDVPAGTISPAAA